MKSRMAEAVEHAQRVSSSLISRMAKEKKRRFEITEALPNTMFRGQAHNDHILGRISGKMSPSHPASRRGPGQIEFPMT